MIIGIDASRAFIPDRTGTENYSYHLIKEMLRLPESKIHTFVLFIRPKTSVESELDGYTNVIVKVVPWRYLWTQLGLAWATWKVQTLPECGSPSLRECRELDVLWVPAHTLPIFRNPHIKTVVTIHGLEYQWLPEYKNLLQRWYLPLSTIYAARSADQLIAVSHFTAKQLEKELHTNRKKIKVVYEGTEFSSNPVIQYSSGTLRKYGLQDKKYILFVGTIQPRKNLAALIAAFARLGTDLADYRLVIAGSVGWLASEVFAAVQKHQVQDRVVFTGRVSQIELESLYMGAKLYVQPSITEGFGLPVLEAMKYGVPVIGSDGGALGEVIGKAGIIVSITNQKFSNSQIESGFVDRLAKEMEKVLREPKLRTKMAVAGKLRVGELTWSKAAKETLKVLLNV